MPPWPHGCIVGRCRGGCCDGYERGQIRGWAWFPNRPHESVVVQVCVDGAVVAESAACIERPDLRSAGIGQGRHAFAIPFVIDTDAPPVVHVQVRARDGALLRDGDFVITTSGEEREAAARRRTTEYLEAVFGPFSHTGITSPAPPGPKLPQLNFILYSSTAAASDLPGTLGAPEYSYFFVMREFREVLRRLGVVHMVRDPAAEVDAIYTACAARGETCLYFSFAPPHHTVLGLRAPTIPVVAWEYSSIPDDPWGGNPRNDWRYVLRQTGRAISISGFGANAIKAAMGEHFQAVGIPTPVWDRLSGLRSRIAQRPHGGAVTLRLDGFVWDSRTANFYLGMDMPPIPAMSARPKPVALPLRGLTLLFAATERRAAEATAAAAAADAAQAAEQSAAAIPPPVRILIEPPARRGRRETLRATAAIFILWYRTLLRPALPWPLARGISLAGRVASRWRHRRRAAALVSAQDLPMATPLQAPAWPEVLPSYAYPARNNVAHAIEQPLPEPDLAEPYPPAPQAVTPPARGTDCTIEGIVFTNVLAPKDGRKNWQDLVLAFTDAFRNTPDATLVLKMIGADPAYWWWEFHDLITRVPVFACRVLILHGYLDDTNYNAMIEASHFISNTSLAEGQCLPLAEFMSAGRPAIAPLHTAMLDYITPENALILASEIEYCSWPHDPRNHLLTTRHRLEYPTLVSALREAYRIAATDPERWDSMARAAADAMRGYCADDVVAEQLAELLALDRRTLAQFRQPAEAVTP